MRGRVAVAPSCFGAAWWSRSCEERGAARDQDDELDRGDRGGDERRGAPGERAGQLLGMVHGRLDSAPGRPLLLRGHPGPRRREPVGQRELRPPAELGGRERGVEHAPLELAQPRRRELGRAADSRRRLDRVVQLEHRRLRAGADVEDAAVVVEREQQRAGDVADVHVVARLAAVAEDASELRLRAAGP